MGDSREGPAGGFRPTVARATSSPATLRDSHRVEPKSECCGTATVSSQKSELLMTLRCQASLYEGLARACVEKARLARMLSGEREGEAPGVGGCDD
jgi:hypothetical protein